MLEIQIVSTKNVKLLWQLMPENKKDLDVFHDWFIVLNQGSPVGLLEIQPLTLTTGNIHIHIHKNSQGKGIGPKIYLPALEYIKKYTIYHKLISTVANDNNRIIHMMKNTGFKICGLIKEGIYETNEKGIDILKDLLIFELKIPRE